MAKDFIAGSFAGATGMLAGYPFDTVKVLIQTQDKNHYKSTFQTMSLIHKEYGFCRLYRGICTPMLTVSFYNAITFSVYETSMKNISKKYDMGSEKYFIAGTISGAARVIQY